MEPSHEHSGLLAQIAIGASTVISWLWAVIFRNSKRLDEMNQATHKRLDHMEVQIAKIEYIDRKLDETSKKIDRLIERELDKNG